MPQYRLKPGVGLHYDHTDPDVPVSKTGAIVESDKPLDQLFPEKWEVYHPTLTAAEAAALVWPPVGFEDVTASVPAARDNGLVVLKRGKDYAICEDGQGPEACLNKDKPLRKSEVAGFIDSYLEAQAATKAPAATKKAK